MHTPQFIPHGAISLASSGISQSPFGPNITPGH
jgi:hypothetical protein